MTAPGSPGQFFVLLSSDCQNTNILRLTAKVLMGKFAAGKHKKLGIMKAKLLLTLAVAASGMAAVACNKAGTSVDIAAEVAGSYTGTTSASFQYSPDPMVTENETFVLTAAGDGAVDVSFESATWGSFSFDGVSVTGSDPYALKGEGTTLMGMGDEKSEYKATFEGTVGKQAGTADFLITVPAVMGGLTIEFSLAE